MSQVILILDDTCNLFKETFMLIFQYKCQNSLVSLLYSYLKFTILCCYCLLHSCFSKGSTLFEILLNIFFISSSLSHTFQLHNSEVILRLYLVLVRPHLDSESQFQSPYYRMDIRLLELVLRRMTEMIHVLRYLWYVERHNNETYFSKKVSVRRHE